MDIFDGQKFNKIKKRNRILILYSLIFFITVYFYVQVIEPPKWKEPVLIHIVKGDSLSEIAKKLKDENIVKSEKFVQSIIAFLEKDKQVQSGDYYFDKPLPVYKVAIRLAGSFHNIAPIKITFPEGFTNREMANLLGNKIPDFNKLEFLEKIKDQQGYLFPDTYFFYPLTTIDEIILAMKNNFDKKIKALEDFKNTEYTSSQIIVMASIVELEANGENDSSIIAGILWKRFSLNMPLQVDVYPESYKKKGLPESPIANPGLRAIKATLNPTESQNLFYLHDRNGDIHLAKNFAEHKKNIAKYLK